MWDERIYVDTALSVAYERGTHREADELGGLCLDRVIVDLPIGREVDHPGAVATIADRPSSVTAAVSSRARVDFPDAVTPSTATRTGCARSRRHTSSASSSISVARFIAGG